MVNSRNGREASAKHPCPCCGKQKHCLIFQDGGANCYHSNDPALLERQDRNGASYRVFPAGEGQGPGPDPLPTLEHGKASADKVNRVYRELQQQLTLNPVHRAQLLERGLPDVAIREHGFRSMHSPVVRATIALSIADRFSDWQGVPGFYCDPKTGKARLAASEGLVIFGKDLAGNVASVQVRRDNVKTDQARYYWLSSAKHGGPSSGSLPTWWPPVSRARTEGVVRVTEGALKAIVAAELTGVPGIAAGAGVGSMASDAVLEMLQELRPETVLFTPDADAFKNHRVAGHVRDALGKLQSSGFQLQVETWDGAAKGIDDALKAGLKVRTEAPEAYLARLVQAFNKAGAQQNLLERGLLALHEAEALHPRDAGRVSAHVETLQKGGRIAVSERPRLQRLLSRYAVNLLELGINLNDLVEQEEGLKAGQRVEKQGAADVNTQVSKLLKLTKGWKWLRSDGQVFASMAVSHPDGSSSRETLRFSRGGVRKKLLHLYHRAHKTCPSSEALAQAYATLEAQAEFEGEEARVWLRTASANGRVYLDLCDERGRVVEISDAGWKVTTDPPVYFHRNPGMLALPEPARGGSLAELRPFVNCRSDEQFTLAVAWLVFAVFPLYPHPVLVLEGNQGSGKSSLLRLLRAW